MENENKHRDVVSDREMLEANLLISQRNKEIAQLNFDAEVKKLEQKTVNSIPVDEEFKNIINNRKTSLPLWIVLITEIVHYGFDLITKFF